MTSLEELLAETTKALKSGDTERVNTLRLLVAALKNRAIQKRSESGSDKLSEEDIGKVLSSEAKKRREAISLFEKGGRDDLVRKERAELSIIEAYLPKGLSPREVEELVVKVAAHEPDIKEFGLLMKRVMAEAKGKADARVVSELVKKIIASRG